MMLLMLMPPFASQMLANCLFVCILMFACPFLAVLPWAVIDPCSLPLVSVLLTSVVALLADVDSLVVAVGDLRVFDTLHPRFKRFRFLLALASAAVLIARVVQILLPVLRMYLQCFRLFAAYSML